MIPIRVTSEQLADYLDAVSRVPTKTTRSKSQPLVDPPNTPPSVACHLDYPQQ